MKKKLRIVLLSIGAVIASCLLWGVISTHTSPTIKDASFAGGSGTIENPWQIENVEQLVAINKHLDGCFILINDIDLSDYNNFVAIGKYVQDKNSEEGEDPIAEYAFTGVFDGNGHTISNFKRTQWFGMGIGLFNCISEGTIKNLTLKNADVKGSFLVSDLCGYSFKSTIENVRIEDSNVYALMIMAGSITGGSSFCKIDNCYVSGICSKSSSMGLTGALGGGVSHPESFTNNIAENCTVIANLGKSGYCVGGMCGCVNVPLNEVTNCNVKNITITVSGKGELVGGLFGGTGNLEDNETSITLISDCNVNNASIIVDGTTKYIGGAIGGGMADEDTGARQSEIINNMTLTEVNIEAPKAEDVNDIVGLMDTVTIE